LERCYRWLRQFFALRGFLTLQTADLGVVYRVCSSDHRDRSVIHRARRAHIAGPSDILGMVGADFSNACRFSSLVYPEEVVDSEEG
jgi:hypothetical protein